MTRELELASNGDLRVMAAAQPNGSLQLHLEERGVAATGEPCWTPIWSGLVGVVSSAPPSAHALRALHLVARELLYKRGIERANETTRKTERGWPRPAVCECADATIGPASALPKA